MTVNSQKNASSRLMAFTFSIAAFSVVLLQVGCDSTQQAATEPISSANETAKTRDDLSVVADSLSEDMVGQTVNITGEVIQQCPSSGCWLKLQVGDRETCVDLNSSPVRLSQNRVGQQVRIIGEVAKRGSDLTINAQQVEFIQSQQDAPQDKELGS